MSNITSLLSSTVTTNATTPPPLNHDISLLGTHVMAERPLINAGTPWIAVEQECRNAESGTHN